MQACGVLRGSELEAMKNVAVFDSVYGAQGNSGLRSCASGMVVQLKTTGQSAFSRKKGFYGQQTKREKPKKSSAMRAVRRSFSQSELRVWEIRTRLTTALDPRLARWRFTAPSRSVVTQSDYANSVPEMG